MSGSPLANPSQGLGKVVESRNIDFAAQGAQAAQMGMPFDESRQQGATGQVHAQGLGMSFRQGGHGAHGQDPTLLDDDGLAGLWALGSPDVGPGDELDGGGRLRRQGHGGLRGWRKGQCSVRGGSGDKV